MLFFAEYLPEGLGEVLIPHGSQGSNQPNSRHKPSPEPDPELGIGSLVEVMSTKPLYGLIKWIGNLPDQKEPKKLIAGLEMVRAVGLNIQQNLFLFNDVMQCFI